MNPHLVAPLEAGLGCLAALLHALHEDSEAAFAAPQQGEEQRRLPGGFLERNLPPLGLGGTGDVQQSQVALHFLHAHTGDTKETQSLRSPHIRGTTAVT